MKGIVGI